MVLKKIILLGKRTIEQKIETKDSFRETNPVLKNIKNLTFSERV